MRCGTLYWRRVPGLVPAQTTGLATPRGMIDWNGTLYAAYAGSVAAIVPGTSVGAYTYPGDATGGVTWARNNNAGGSQLIACKENGGAHLFTAGGMVSYTAGVDSDLPSDVNSVDFLDGYFLFSRPNGQLWASDLNTTAVNALSFTTCDAQ